MSRGSTLIDGGDHLGTYSVEITQLVSYVTEFHFTLVPLDQVPGDVPELGREVLVDEEDVHRVSLKFEV